MDVREEDGSNAYELRSSYNCSLKLDSVATLLI